jgi:hypothetical protein
MIFGSELRGSERNEAGMYIMMQVTGPHVCDTAKLKKENKMISPCKVKYIILKKSRTDT